MTRITRSTVTTDAQGRVYHQDTERLRDDDRGHTEVTQRSILARCGACHRPVSHPEQVTGRCDLCGTGPLCVTCDATCAICQRRLCRQCRRGYVWGRTPIAACLYCFRRLNRRARYEQLVAQHRLAIQAQRGRQQDRARWAALRLQAARMFAGLKRIGRNDPRRSRRGR